jgi:hypothetical protein
LTTASTVLVWWVKTMMNREREGEGGGGGEGEREREREGGKREGEGEGERSLFLSIYRMVRDHVGELSVIVPTLMKYPHSAATVTEEVKTLLPSIFYSCSNIIFISIVCNVPLTSGKIVQVRPSFTYFDPSDRCQRYDCFRNFSFSHTNLTANCPTLNCPTALQTLPMGKCCPVCMCKLLLQAIIHCRSCTCSL